MSSIRSWQRLGNRFTPLRFVCRCARLRFAPLRFARVCSASLGFQDAGFCFSGSDLLTRVRWLSVLVEVRLTANAPTHNKPTHNKPTPTDTGRNRPATTATGSHTGRLVCCRRRNATFQISQLRARQSSTRDPAFPHSRLAPRASAIALSRFRQRRITAVCRQRPA